jgi:aspartate kinase
MDKILVMKFGGTSLMTPERIRDAAQIVDKERASGKQIVVVVSAMGHTTDELIRLSEKVTALPDKLELDALMATGEQVSATLMSMALQALGRKSKSFNGRQIGILTDDRFGDARIKSMDTKILYDHINDGVIPVVTGFQGVTVTGETTTLGRGGSDTTAIALAAAMHAERCDIYTDVEGMYSADPRIVKTAVKLRTVSMSEMLELAKGGAQVLNARSVELARDRQVTVRVRSTFHPVDVGTLVTTDSDQMHNFTGVAVKSNLNCIEIYLQKLEMGVDRRLSTFRLIRSKTKRDLLTLLSDAGIVSEIVDPIRPNPFRILLLVEKADTVRALSILHNTTLSIKGITASTNVSAISLVATKITAKHYVEAVEAMVQNKIGIMASAWHCQRLTLVAPLSVTKQAANALHFHFAGINVAASHHSQLLKP